MKDKLLRVPLEIERHANSEFPLTALKPPDSMKDTRKPSDDLQHVFNDDLLTHKNDSHFVRKRFPEIKHILDNPRLKKEFAEYDKPANKARDRVRLLGFIAVFASTAALVSLTTRPLWPHSLWNRWVAAAIELAGMAGAILAIGGLWFGSWKSRWLQNRLMTERLRQWHFQLLVNRGAEIEASCNGANAIEAFEKRRDQWLAEALRAYRGKRDSQLESVVQDPVENMVWLHVPQTTYSSNSGILREVFDAYAILRIDHQLDYSAHKLESSTNKPLWQFLQWPPRAQLTVISTASSFCFIVALVLAVFLVCVDVLALGETSEPYVRTAAVVVALLGAALRTIQEGLGLHATITRYGEYHERISRIKDRFEAISDEKERLELMRQLECASVVEMQDFLRAHHKARFVLA